MKLYQLIIVILLMTAIAVMTGCEYDVAEPAWEKEKVIPPTPSITQIEPPEGAPAGVNTITIMGENFSEVAENNHVYFDNVLAEIKNATTTSISVHRPNLVIDSAEIKVVSYDALVVAKYSPYKIDEVMERYGNFIENLQLRAVAVDDNENCYVFQQAPNTVFKISPDGEKEILGETTAITWDAAISPDGNVIITSQSKTIKKLDVVTGEIVKWAEVSKNVRYGTFDDSGNFYAAGRRTDVFVIAAGDTIGEKAGFYADDEIFCMRFFENHLYLLVELRNPDADNPELAIWRHSANGDGNLGNRELILDWANTGEYAEFDPTTFTIDKNGIIYIGSEYEHPVMAYNPVNGNQDILYKGILPSYASKLVWGANNYFYMVLTGDENDLVRIDMGDPDVRN